MSVRVSRLYSSSTAFGSVLSFYSHRESICYAGAVCNPLVPDALFVEDKSPGSLRVVG